MKNKALTTVLALIVSVSLSAQKYLINTYNGQTVSTCSGVFYDSGDSLGNYGINENYTVTFCSTTGILSMNFTSMNITLKDFLYVYDGPSTSYPLIKTLSFESMPQIINSSCGCLTFRFTSDKAGTVSGWRGVID
ncbi:MAG: hypothetical protein EOM23_11765, partial [Candidatus Moranbacteria bacterium]|nr:hypothetical protein [Candidatus Moranbacteria bacterium]